MLVAVLKGGMSRERGISLITGAACAAGLHEAGFETVEIDIGTHALSQIAAIRPQVCFNALHGPRGEDGSIQGALNILGIPYTHSGVTASAIAMDKPIAKLLAAQAGLAVAKGCVVDKQEFWLDVPSYPFVLKPLNDGSSFDTFIVRDPEQLPFTEASWPFTGPALIEEYIGGAELTVTVLDDQPLAVTEIVHGGPFYDYAAKYQTGGSQHIIPARIPDYVRDTCLSQALVIHRALGCRGISRSDFILNKKTNIPVFLEINTQPGMTPTSLAPEQASHVGITFPDLMSRIVSLATTD